LEVILAAREVVFISSVSEGMAPYREGVRKAIEDLDAYHCIAMEGFGARDESSFATCHSKVEECTLFVGIVGHQYGSTSGSTGKSFSELEYDAAVELGKRRLMFLAPDDFPVQAHLIESDDKRKRQRAFRERVKADRQVAFFSSSDELGKLVLQAIHNCQMNLSERQSTGGSTCKRTRLLFPFVTSAAGFDTGLAISNVSLDPFGTEPTIG
jgi:hypothetical protein